MSVIYTIGDRILLAGVQSRSNSRSMIPLYAENRTPTDIRLVEGVVTGVSTIDAPASVSDAPARNAVMYFNYTDTNNNPRQLEFNLWLLSTPTFAQAVRRTLDRMPNLTPEQREFMLYYSYPRPIASLAYTRMLRDLVMAVTPNAEAAPRIVISDRDTAFEHAAALSIPTYPYDLYRNISAVIEEPEVSDETEVTAEEDNNPFTELSSSPELTWSPVLPRTVFDRVLTGGSPAGNQSEAPARPAVPAPEEFEDDDDSWMSDDPMDEEDDT